MLQSLNQVIEKSGNFLPNFQYKKNVKEVQVELKSFFITLLWNLEMWSSVTTAIEL